MTLRYTAIFQRQVNGGYQASCPALPGCHSQGDSLDDATANVREAIELYVESLRAHNEPVPREDLLIKPIEVAVPA